MTKRKQTAFRFNCETCDKLRDLKGWGFTWTESVERGIDLVHTVEFAKRLQLYNEKESCYTKKIEESEKSD